MLRIVKSCRGFTLVEILVVMVIVGLMAGMAVLAIGGDPHRQLKQEAQRIRSILQLTADEALLQGQEYGLKLTREGYQVVQFDDEKEQWLEPQHNAFKPYEFPGGITLTLESEGTLIDLEELNKSEEEKAEEKYKKNSTIDEQDKLKPSLLLLSSGEMTPFTLQLHSADSEQHVELSGDGLGDIHLGDLDAG